MPYLISDATDCPSWAVIKEDGEVIACHDTKQSAIDQAIAISLEEGTEFLGERNEERQVNLTAPAYFRASARRGLRWVEEGRGGDGLLDRTIAEARAMAEGNITAEKWVRLRSFLARQIVNFDAPAANPNHEDYPSPGVVAIALWGGGGTRRRRRSPRPAIGD